MNDLFHQPLFYIYFIYGVSFLTMAFVTLYEVRKATSMVLVTTFEMLAAFGLTHGIREMLDWARFIVANTGHPEIEWLKLLGDVFLVVSYVVLLQFAVNLLSYRSERKTAYRMIPAALVAAGAVAMIVTRTYDADQVGFYARHTFGFVGSLLAGVAFCKLALAMRAIESARIQSGLILGALGFCAYSVFGGLIVTTVAGQPVQLFRAVCAFSIAAASFLFLGIFRRPISEQAAVGSGAVLTR